MDDEQGSFRADRGYVDWIFTLKMRKHARKKCRVYLGFIDLEKVYDIR